MENKDFMKKVIAILEKQQNTLKKIAQEVAANTQGQDITSTIAPVIQQAATETKANPKNYGVQSAFFYPQEGVLKVKMQYPMSLLGTPESNIVKNKTKELLSVNPEYKKVEIIGVTA